MLLHKKTYFRAERNWESLLTLEISGSFHARTPCVFFTRLVLCSDEFHVAGGAAGAVPSPSPPLPSPLTRTILCGCTKQHKSSCGPRHEGTGLIFWPSSCSVSLIHIWLNCIFLNSILIVAVRSEAAVWVELALHGGIHIWNELYLNKGRFASTSLLLPTLS